MAAKDDPTAAQPASPPPVLTAPVRISELRCSSYRGLDELTLELDPKITLLVGRNNSGKSRILRALALAVGAARAERDDLTVDGPEEAFIDVVVAPILAEGEDRFDARLAGSMGPGVRQVVSEEPFRERIAWRTTISRSAEGFGAQTGRRLLLWDNQQAAWRPGSVEVPRRVLGLVGADLVETRRDLASELRERGSAAHRLVDDLELDPSAVPELQRQLDALSAAIVAGSGTLKSIAETLRVLASRVDAVGQPRIMPFPGSVDDLSSVASIELDDQDGRSLPLRYHGTGARSLASLRLRGTLYERRLGADGGTIRPHPLTLIEEPEAHLHPQAQFDLAGLFDEIPGQLVASTHSSHVVSEFDHDRLRLLRARPGGVKVAVLQVAPEPVKGVPRQLTPNLYPSEMEKLRRSVERPFGEILFASVLVLGDGATERALLPPLIRHALGPAAHGLCVIDPGSMGDPASVGCLKAAQLLGIPWFIFADSDQKGRKAVQVLLDELPLPEPPVQVRAEHVVEIGGDAATEKLFVDFDRDLCVAAAKGARPDIDTSDPLDALHRLKGAAGRYLAKELIERHPPGDWPPPLIRLVDLIRAALPEAERDKGDAT